MERTLFTTIFEDLYNEVYGTFSATSIPHKTFEDETGYQLQLAVPGYSKKDIEVKLIDNVLYLKYDKPEKEESPWKFSFYKKFNIKNGLDIKNIEATMDNGILTIKFGKGAEYKKNIEIK